jgi:CBS domain-containing protein
MIPVEKITPVARERLVTVRDDAPLTAAAKFLDGGHTNLVVVCDKSGAMVGITRTDIVRQMSRCRGCGCTAGAATVMTKDVSYCHPDDLFEDVWTTMKERRLLHVPVVGDDVRPIG